jgi:hypothetical protein
VVSCRIRKSAPTQGRRLVEGSEGRMNLKTLGFRIG